jgi:cytochrome c
MKFALAAVMAITAAPVLAESHASGDSANGEAIFNRQCVSCHVVQNEAGEVLAGRNAKTGPNLFHAVGRQPGTYPDFAYGDAMVAYGETGVVWEEENFVGYVQDPTDFLRTALDDRRARGKMAFQLRSATDAADVYAYLATFATEAAN